jgi:uncharacterized protein
VEFDRFTIVLLVLRPDAPVLDDEAAAALQDAHLAHLAELHEAGRLLAAGPLTDDVLRGLCIYDSDTDEARALAAADPAVRAGRLEARVLPWMLPAGAIAFAPSRFPRSAADAE